VGLSGRSFIPLLSSFACAVPGIMATRTVQDPKERLITIMIAPLMTCSARLPVYAVIIAAFIPAQTVYGFFNLQGLVLFALYAAGIVSAAIIAWIMRRNGAADTFPLLLELPSYRWPDPLNLLRGLWERIWIFLRRVGTIILALSILLCLPHDMSCETLINITKTLTKKGADIFELNTVRKHFSEIQGGGLAKVCYPAQVVSLIFSDVLGNDLSMVASGPTVYDKTTVADAAKILLKYDVLKTCIPPDCQFLETPKHPKYFTKVKNVLVCSNLNALEAMREKAEELGFNAHIENTMLSGEASEVGKSLALREPKAGSCILFGGETTVEIKGDGSGGRNQELALSALPYMQPNSSLISASSDGWDNTDHAGALVDQELLEKAKNLNLSPEEYLAKSDSYNFFKQARDGALCTGRLGSNVSDLVIMLYR
jgi:hypothetical protein